MTQHGTIFSIQKPSLTQWGESKCVHSDLSYFEKEDESSPLSVKLVLKGTEEYQVNGVRFKLHEKQFLIVNEGDEVVTKVKGEHRTKGVCIYPPQQLIANVCAQSDLSISSQLELAENSATNNMRFTSVPVRMVSNAMAASFMAGQTAQLLSGRNLSAEWWETFYLELVDRLVKDQLNLEDKLNQLTSAKKQTKEELFRRLSIAKDYIYDHRFETVNIDSLAKTCALSKFHFLRNFKAFYGCSPYQLSLQLKLKEAMTLIQKNYSYQRAADEVGYSDSKNLRKALVKNRFLRV